LRILILLHGLPPVAGRPVIGTGLRAFANGEALRQRGHEVFYCTRTEDLPDSTPAAKTRSKGSNKKKTPASTRVTGLNHPPGDPRRVHEPASAALTSAAGKGIAAFEGRAVAPAPDAIRTNGLATLGGVLGAAGNPLHFTDTHELHDIVRHVDPDVVLVEAPEEVRRLPPGQFSVILDLFAPRILEQQFQDKDDEREEVRILDALQRGDGFVFSNERQKYYHLPLLALAGVDCTEQSGAVAPISCPPEMLSFSKPKEPVFIAGGVFWPWADLGPALVALHASLKKANKGKIHLYGGEYGIRSDTQRYTDPREFLPKRSKHLRFKGMVPIDTLWKEYARGSVAFDLTTPNPERDLNLSFRQVDYLRCGLPIITSPRQVIAGHLEEYGAGWCVEPGDTKALDKLVRDLLAHPDKVLRASSAAQKLAAEQYTWDAGGEALDALVRQRPKREHTDTFVNRISRTQADLWQEHEENKRLRETVLYLQDDQSKKSEELQSLNQKLGVLLGSVDRLSGSLTAVSRFKNDMLLFLHEQEDAALREAAELTTEVERLQLDIKKKEAAIKAGKREQAKAASALTRQEEQNKAELDKKDEELASLAREFQLHRDKSDAALAAQQDKHKAEFRRKEADAQRLTTEKTQLQKRLDQALETGQARTDKLAEAQVSISDLKGRLDLANNQVEVNRLEGERLKDRLEQASFEQQKRLQELDKKEREVAKAQKTRDTTKARLEAAKKKLEESITRLEFENRTLLEEGAKKDDEVQTAQSERDKLKAGLEASIKSLEERLVGSEFENRTRIEEMAKKDGEIEEIMAERDALKAKLEGNISSLEERLVRLDHEFRTVLEQLAKKEGEFEILDRAHTRVLTEHGAATTRLGSVTARLEEAEFQVTALTSEVAKKTEEIADAQARRDALADALREEKELSSRGGVLLRRKLKSNFLGRNDD